MTKEHRIANFSVGGTRNAASPESFLCAPEEEEEEEDEGTKVYTSSRFPNQFARTEELLLLLLVVLLLLLLFSMCNQPGIYDKKEYCIISSKLKLLLYIFFYPLCFRKHHPLGW